MQAVDDYINRVRFLPPAPRIVPELMKLLKQTDLDSSKVVKLVSYDPALTANVLRICNSAYFGAATTTCDLQEAVTRLGFQQVYQLVTAVMGARMLGASQPGYGLDDGELWKHSIAVAVTAQMMARKLSDDENLIFTAALLHDIGKIILAQALETIYPKLVRETEMNQQSLLESEKKLLGVQHAEVGARLLERWKFPPNIVASVWFHHSPKGAGNHQRLASYIYLADMIAHFMGHGYGHLAFALRGRSEALTILGLTSESIPQFLMESFDEMRTVEALFSLAA
ncbi:MAG TPA: HDOD domain-containing protein [Candidatus Baltobacteraceae bacterium]|jgi:putative nucleotidyltransferase with HDIG domain|nr:HDOD domain-containing protein [Candidatus Baltobacteraceae bacterium]